MNAPTPPATTLARPDGLDHLECCANHDVALCGTDLTGASYYPADAGPGCVVCKDLDAGDPYLCPRTGLPCPGVGWC